MNWLEILSVGGLGCSFVGTIVVIGSTDLLYRDPDVIWEKKDPGLTIIRSKWLEWGLGLLILGFGVQIVAKIWSLNLW